MTRVAGQEAMDALQGKARQGVRKACAREKMLVVALAALWQDPPMGIVLDVASHVVLVGAP